MTLAIEFVKKKFVFRKYWPVVTFTIEFEKKLYKKYSKSDWLTCPGTSQTFFSVVLVIVGVAQATHGSGQRLNGRSKINLYLKHFS